MNKWNYFRECSRCKRAVAPRKRNFTVKEYICTNCLGFSPVEGDIEFKFRCGPEIRNEICFGPDWQTAFKKVLERTNATALSSLLAFKVKGEATKFASTEVFLKDQNMWATQPTSFRNEKKKGDIKNDGLSSAGDKGFGNDDPRRINQGQA